MRASIVGLVVAVVIGTGVVQAQKGHAEASVAGRWTMAVDSPHEAAEMGLTLSQDGSRVTGTFASPHGDMPVQGEFADGNLKLATTSEEAGITFSAKLKDKDTLTGYISSSMGDMTFTAKRVAEK
jgi:hypothetical protein